MANSNNSSSIRQRKKRSNKRENHLKNGSNNNDDDDEDDALLKNYHQQQQQQQKRHLVQKYLWIGAGFTLFALSMVIIWHVLSRTGQMEARSEPGGGGSSGDMTNTTTSTPPMTTIATVTQRYQILQTYAHDPKSFTQGLTMAASVPDAQKSQQQQQQQRQQPQALLVESTGMYGQSYIRIWDPITQHNHQERPLDDHYFGEGMTSFALLNVSYYMVLTYREGKVLIYDTALNLVQTVDSPVTTTGEAWGCTFRVPGSDEDDLIFFVTDGSHHLLLWKLEYQQQQQQHPQQDNAILPIISLQEIQRIPVSLLLQRPDGSLVQKDQVPRLNELEYDATTKTILANIWFEPVVLRIDPTTGNVIKIYDLSRLAEPMKEAASKDMNIVMNGIALIPGTTILKEEDTSSMSMTTMIEQQEWYVTGKYWHDLYRVRVLE
jgi:glutaminyl-peptide cyclotransferase